MSQQLAPHAPSFALNEWLFASALGAIPETQADRRLVPATNTPRGIAVHVVMARHSLCRLLGGSPPALPWKDVGEEFEAGFKEGGERPSLKSVKDAWDALQPVFHHALLSASKETLAAPSPLPIPGNERPTVADFAALNVVHECYHLGQLGLMTKAIVGKGIMTPPPADPVR